MLGRKWREKFEVQKLESELLLNRCDIIEDEISELKTKLAELQKQLVAETETREEEASPYFNPKTRLYDFRYGKDWQTGGSNK